MWLTRRPLVAREGGWGPCDRGAGAGDAGADIWVRLQDYLTAGEEEDHVVFDTDYGKTSMLVCWDMAWPEAFRSVSHFRRRRGVRSHRLG